jgi:hypothetical protein
MRKERDDEQRDERAVTGHYGFAIARPRQQHRAEHGRAAARLVRWKMHDEHDLEPAFYRAHSSSAENSPHTCARHSSLTGRNAHATA